MSRQIDVGRMTSEREKLQKCLDDGHPLNTDVYFVEDRAKFPNTVAEDEVGVYRPPTARKAAIADMERIQAFQQADLDVPSFLEAGPRAELRFDPHNVRAVIATTGGVASEVIRSARWRMCPGRTLRSFASV